MKCATPQKINIAASLLTKKATKFLKKNGGFRKILIYKELETKVPLSEGFREAINIYTFQF